MSMRYFIYDIETVVDKSLLNRVGYPGLGLTDDEAYQKELATLNAAEPGRTFVNPAFHEPVSIVAMAVDDRCAIQKIKVLGEEDRDGKRAARSVPKFWSVVSDARPILVDFNGKGFDLRVLELWAYRLGISLPEAYFEKYGMRNRYNLDKHLDLYEFLTNHGAVRWKGGLNLFAKLVGCPGKMDVRGDQVQALYEAGRQEEIDDYCMQDVMDTYFVFLRVQVMLGNLDRQKEQHAIASARKFIEQFSQESPYLKSYLDHCHHF